MEVPADSSSADSALQTVEHSGAENLVRISTPGVRTIAELTAFVGKGAEHMIKTLLYVADGQLVAALVRGDHELNDIALKQVLGAEELILADDAAIAAHPNLKVGFLGPIGLNLPMVVDADVAVMKSAITGANEVDVHVSGVRPGIDFALERVERIRFAAEGMLVQHVDHHLCLPKVLRLDTYSNWERNIVMPWVLHSWIVMVASVRQSWDVTALAYPA